MDSSGSRRSWIVSDGEPVTLGEIGAVLIVVDPVPVAGPENPTPANWVALGSQPKLLPLHGKPTAEDVTLWVGLLLDDAVGHGVSRSKMFSGV